MTPYLVIEKSNPKEHILTPPILPATTLQPNLSWFVDVPLYQKQMYACTKFALLESIVIDPFHSKKRFLKFLVRYFFVNHIAMDQVRRGPSTLRIKYAMDQLRYGSSMLRIKYATDEACYKSSTLWFKYAIDQVRYGSSML